MKYHKIMARNNGFILAEIIIFITLIAILATAGIGAHFFIRDALVNFKNRSTAMNLAVSQMEDLRYKWKTGDYHGNPFRSGNHPNDTLINSDVPHGFDISYSVEDRVDPVWDEDGDATDSDYKIIIVTCEYPPDKEIRFTGFFVE